MRAQTIPIKKISKVKLAVGRLLYPDNENKRPRYRYECKHGVRPCPFVSCKYHLYLDVNPRTGTLKINFPDTDISEMKETCVLDIADRFGATLEEVGELMNITRERVRQLELSGMEKLKLKPLMKELKK